jgi:hypothetical protein
VHVLGCYGLLDQLHLETQQKMKERH